jgi:hypothetical protein
MPFITGKGAGLFGSGMHDFILMDLELGERVAMWQDDEDCGFGALFDLQYAKAMQKAQLVPFSPAGIVL